MAWVSARRRSRAALALSLLSGLCCRAACDDSVGTVAARAGATERVLAQASPTLASPDFSVYLTAEAASRRVRNTVAAHPDIMQLDTLRAELNGYSASIDVVTVNFAAAHGVPPHRQLRVWLNFGEHGRELITTDVAVRLLDALAGGPDAAARLAGGGADVAAALRRSVLKVVPLENAGGRAKVEAGELCLRKNGRGVDPNRNWDIHWGVKEPDYDPYEEAAGAAPFSEPEAVLLRDALSEWRPHGWVNVHSGMRALFVPFDHGAAMPPGRAGDALRTMLAAMQRRFCPDCVTGSGGGAVGYLAHGTATDYVFANLSVPVAMTWEIYGDSAASNDDCFRMFNPVDKAQHDALLDAWAAACVATPWAVAMHPDAPPDVPAAARMPWGRKGGAEAVTDAHFGAMPQQVGWAGQSAALMALLLVLVWGASKAPRRLFGRGSRPSSPEEAATEETKQMV